MLRSYSVRRHNSLCVASTGKLSFVFLVVADKVEAPYFSIIK